ncbi:ricin-type beta-trefoil lectin domain protein [Tropicimonas sp. TH_r6]|uniref:ricin-type beta-trefoil lectin domain protein n=1 Tax=Tropicimonas sp. TH_r6 TaxID=3082085 RepID=UPI0029535818|nr:ricin-type beta-trefoil lectin domain protein [Tropicimonas sp. TH_r6]MDV7145334.1 ricin-type beta-trefoil lectin domain protein [Tropicimonas sp. TH_r6]
MFNPLTLAVLTATTLAAGTARAENVEIYLTDMLDNIQVGYCLDIAGAKGASADPADGLQGHTCYSPGGELGVDQIFETGKLADGILYMPEFDVCAHVASAEAGAAIALAACDGSAAQSFSFSGEGTITPASASDLCVTVGEDTRSGRSDVNQIKALTLETCAADKAAYQSWKTRSSVE